MTKFPARVASRTKESGAELAARIAIIDDHPYFRDGLRAQIAELGHEIVGEAGDAIRGIALVQETRPDLATVDLQVPEMGGGDLLAELRRRSPATKLLVVSGFHSEDLAIAARRAGAHGYLAKTDQREQFSRCIGEVLGGYPFVAPSFTTAGLRAAEERLSGGQPFEDLTRRERVYLRAIADGSTTREVAERRGVSPRTVEALRALLMKKLNLADSRALVRFAIKFRLFL